MHRPEHFLSFSNVDRVEKPDAARDNVEERDDAFNWGVCCNQMGEGMEFVAIKWAMEWCLQSNGERKCDGMKLVVSRQHLHLPIPFNPPLSFSTGKAFSGSWLPRALRRYTMIPFVH